MRKNTPKRSCSILPKWKKGVKTAAHMYHPSHREYPPRANRSFQYPPWVAGGSNNAFYCWAKRYTWRILGLPLIDYSCRGIKQVLVRMTYTRISIEYVILELKLHQPSLSSQSITVQFQYPAWMACSSNNAFYCWTKRWTWRILESHILLS